MSHANSGWTGHPRQELILTLPGQSLKSSKISEGAGGHLIRATGDTRDSKGSDPFVLLRGLLNFELGSGGGGGTSNFSGKAHTQRTTSAYCPASVGRGQEDPWGLLAFSADKKNRNPGSGSDLNRSGE